VNRNSFPNATVRKKSHTHTQKKNTKTPHQKTQQI